MIVLSIGRPQLPEPDPGFRVVLFYAAVAMWLADAAFGLVALSIGAVSRLAALALALGSLLAMIGIDRLGFSKGPIATIIEPLTIVGVVLVAVGWLLLGVDVAARPLRSDLRTR
jgi:hypothetical protein